MPGWYRKNHIRQKNRNRGTISEVENAGSLVVVAVVAVVAMVAMIAVVAVVVVVAALVDI